MKHLLHLLILSVLLLPLSAWAAARVGGWQPISDVKEAHVVEIGEFAVAEYDRRSKAGLRFERVVRGETQVVSGINYRLVVEAKDGDATKSYEAVVWEKAWLKSMNLTSFTPFT